jgi:molybdopterin/thiamine biosynthesis adenylyltransferase
MIHDRHMGLFVVPNEFEVSVVGVGGIGAVAALCLAKMGVKYMALYDFDEVGVENMATQLLKVSGVGNLKVEDVSSTLHLFSDEVNTALFPIKVDTFTELSGNLVICCVDTIEARKQVFSAALDNNIPYFLDTRMSAMEYQHFLVDARNEQQSDSYAEALYALDDQNVPNAPCTQKATFFTALMAGGHIGNVVKQIVTGEAISHRLVHNIKSDFLMKIPL